MSANSGCGGFYYCRQQRSECVDRPSGSRNTHTHTYHCRWSSLGLRPNAYCRFIDKYLSLLLSHGLMTGQLYLHPWGGGWPYLGTLYKHLQFTIPSSMQECPHLLTFPIHPFMLLGNQHFINVPVQVHFFVTLMDFWLFSENVKRVSHHFLLNHLCISCSHGDSNSNYSTKLKDSRGFLATRDDRFKDQVKAEEVFPKKRTFI